MVAVGASVVSQSATASVVEATPLPDIAWHARLESGYALCKGVVAVIFPHRPEDIMRTASPGGYFVSSDGRSFSYIGYVTAKPDAERGAGHSEYRNFLCTVSPDPGSPSGWSLEAFRWLYYQ